MAGAYACMYLLFMPRMPFLCGPSALLCPMLWKACQPADIAFNLQSTEPTMMFCKMMGSITCKHDHLALAVLLCQKRCFRDVPLDGTIPKWHCRVILLWIRLG